ncbi:phage major capsid protein [Runella sp.]|uniref:phage major capsid protein n=1 Tax=Runella sp. TaxID=1960881 RepID=UPI003017E6B9
MKTLKELKESRGALVTTLTALQGLLNVEKRSMTTEEGAEFDSTSAKIDALDIEIRRAEKLEEIARTAAPGVSTKNEEKEQRAFSFSKLIREAGDNKLSGLEKEMVEESALEARSLGITPSGIYLSNNVMNLKMKESRTMSVGTSTAGGNFVPLEKLGFFDALYAKTVLDQLGATKLTGLSNNVDLTGFSAGVSVAWAAETADAASGDPTTAARQLRSSRIAGYSDVSKQLLLQSNQSIDAEIINSFVRALAVAIEAAAINGSGSSNQPTGLLNTSGIGSVAIGTNGGAPTLAKILELVQVVETANAGIDGKFLINPKLVAKLKQTTIDSGSGAMLMSYMAYFNGMSDQIDGKPVFSTSNVPSNLTKGSSSSVCSAMIYGDWSNLVVGQFGGVELVVDPLSQAIGNKTRIVVNQHIGIAVKQPAAFGAIVDLTTT